MPKLIVNSCIALLLLAHPLLGHAAAVDELRSFYSRTTTLHASFSQKVLDEKGVVTDTMSGSLWLARPAFRWEYHSPYKQIMVNDGKRLWMYDVDLAQVTVRDSAQALAGAPVWLLNGGPELDEQFTLENDPASGGLQWVRMTPKQEGGDFKAARLGLDKGIPRILELMDALGQKTVIDFGNMSTNLVIPASRFKFLPPKNVEVVEG